MADSQNGGVRVVDMGPTDQMDAVIAPRLLRIRQGVVDEDVHAVVLQLVDDVDHAGVAQVGNVFLEGQAQNGHGGPTHLPLSPDQEFDRFFGHVFPHAVVNAPAGHDHVRMIADRLGLVGQIIRIHPDAVPPDQTGVEIQEIPLGARRRQDVAGVDPHAVENHGQLVHQGDVQVALGVFDHFGRLGHPDRGRLVNAGRHHPAVDVGQQAGGRRVGP